MDASELLKRYAAGERDFSGVNLSNAYLRGADLSGAKFSRANLSGANLSRADLNRVDLSDADLFETNLVVTNLSDANLSRTFFNGASLVRANLSRANLNEANMTVANLESAILVSVNLSSATLFRANLSEANLSGANLSGANLRETNLVKTNLTNTQLEGAELDGTILPYQKKSEELQRENQELKKRLSILETQFENLVERQVEKRLIANQGIKAKKLTWEGMRFRSEPEREIAKALDEMGVIFFPLPSGRVMSEVGMKTREVDFLICSRGIWGILECDGEMWHRSAAKDHKRDNDYKRQGLWFIQIFTDKECKKSPKKVVRQFLDMLHKFHEDNHYLITGKTTQTVSSLPQTNLSHQSDSNNVKVELQTSLLSWDEYKSRILKKDD